MISRPVRSERGVEFLVRRRLVFMFVADNSTTVRFVDERRSDRHLRTQKRACQPASFGARLSSLCEGSFPRARPAQPLFPTLGGRGEFHIKRVVGCTHR